MLKDKKFWIGFLVGYLLLSFMPNLGLHSLSMKRKNG